MARYQLTAPDGTSWEVNAPDNASEAEVMAYAKSNWGQNTPSAQPRQSVQPLQSAGGVTRGWDAPAEPDPQRERINAIPEITGRMGELSNNVGFLQALAGMTAFDPDEFGKILTAADPNIGIASTPEGERIAVNNKTGQAFNINKQGPSLMDAVQFGGAAAAFTPAGRLPGIARQAVGGMLTQAAIEGGQAAMGGDVNPGDIALAGVAPVVVNQAGKFVRQIPGRSRAVVRYLDDTLSGKPRQPQGTGIQGFENMPTPQRAALGDVSESTKRADIRELIKGQSVESVGWNVDRKGNIVADEVQRNLIRQGVNDKAVMALRDMTAGDKVHANEMLDLAENYIKGTKGSERKLPQVVIGNNAMKRFDVVKKAQMEAVGEIKQAVTGELKGKPVDISRPVDEFMDKLDELGVKIVDGKPNFKESMVRGSNVAPLRNVLDILKYNYDDAAELHKVKQFISNQLDYDNPAAKPLDRQAENALKGLRAQINEQLRAISPAYAAGNDKFRATAEALNPFAEAMGRRFDPESERAANFVGKELRKTISNYASADDLIESIDGLDAAARSFGGKFNDDIMSQVMLNSELERIFGSFKPNSLQGAFEKALGAGSDRLLGGAAQTAKDIGGAVKDRVMWEAPAKNKIELMKQLKELLNKPVN